MEAKFSMEDMVPFVALEKLKTVVDIETASPRELLIEYSKLVSIFETAYHDVLEHEGFEWEGVSQG